MLSVHEFETYRKVSSAGLRLELVKGYIHLNVSGVILRNHLFTTPGAVTGRRSSDTDVS